MATTSTLHPPVKAERESTPPLTTIPIHAQLEPQKLANTTNPPPPPTSSENNHHQRPPPSPPPHVTNSVTNLGIADSVTNLRNLSAALSAFYRRYDELQGHLDFIKTTIDSKLPNNTNTTTTTTPSPQSQLTTIPLTKTPISSPTITSVLQSETKSQNQLSIAPSTKSPSSNTVKTPVPQSDPKPNTSQKQSPITPSTKTPSSSNIVKTSVLQSESKPSTSPQLQLPDISSTATPSSSNTEKPVVPESEPKPNNEKNLHRSELETLCETMCSRGLRKYLILHLTQVNKLREEVPKALKWARNPSKLVLECFGKFFLQGSRAYTKASHMIPARDASVLVLEFFLLMGLNGVKIESSVKAEAEAAAVAWRKRLINEGGLAKACEVDARGLLLLISGFGIPGVFKNEDIGDLIKGSNVREISNALCRSSVLLSRISEIIEGMLKNKMELEAVDIAYTFEVDDQFPPKTILTSFLRESKETWKRTQKAAQGSITAMNEANKKQLADMKSVIKCLEDHKIDCSKVLPGWQINERILSLEKEIADLDKKIGEKVILKRKADQTESSRKLKTEDVKRSRFAGYVPEQQKAAHADGKKSYDELTQMNLLYGGLPGHNGYSDPLSVLHGSGAGLLPENISGSISVSGGGFIAAGVAAGISAVAGGHLPTSPYAGVHREMLVDAGVNMVNHSGQPYGWHGNAASNERLVGHTIARQPSSVDYDGLYRRSSLFEGFPGLPSSQSVGVSSRNSASDLYQFADAVVESELYQSSGSRPDGTVPPVVPGHRYSSYL